MSVAKGHEEPNRKLSNNLLYQTKSHRYTSAGDFGLGGNLQLRW
jgi:hypothetical protein